MPLLVALVLLLSFVAVVGGCGGADGNGMDGGPTRVSATEFAFDPAEIAVDAGRVTIELVNEGSASHALAIEGNGVEEATDVIGGGETTRLEAELEEGTYEVYCPVGDHRDRGMEGTLRVGGGSTPDDEDGDEDDGGGLPY